MICTALVPILTSFISGEGRRQLTSFDAHHVLVRGSLMQELRQRPECQLSYSALYNMHCGKDDSIRSMLEGGAGFGERTCNNPVQAAQYQAGERAERRDMRSLKIWSASLVQCESDRKRGRAHNG